MSAAELATRADTASSATGVKAELKTGLKAEVGLAERLAVEPL